jgi:superfamily II DNA or RNA helicase
MNIDNLNEQELIDLLNQNDISFLNSKERIINHINNLNVKYIPYPKKDDPNFFEKIYKKKEFYENQYPVIEEEKIDDIQNELCPSKDKNYKLLPHQIVIRNYLNYNTPYNSVLLYHGMGSGKTASSITIAENYKMNISDFNRNKTFVLVSGDTIEQNFRKEIHDVEKGYNQATFTDYINYFPNDRPDVKQRKVDSLIDKNYEIEHYQKLTNIISKKNEELSSSDFKKWIKQTYSNRVFIIDEVHNLKLIDKNEKTIKRYDAVKLIIQNTTNLKLVLLSGTPMGHSVKEIVDLLNLLLINDNKDTIELKTIFKSNLDFTENGEELLNKLSKSYISYVTKENPYTFPKKLFPKNSIHISNFINQKFDEKFELQYDINSEYKIIPCLMKKKQKDNYLKFLNTKKNKVNIQDLIQLQLIKYDFEAEALKEGKDKIIYDIPFDDFKEDKIENLSTKLYQLLHNIKKSKGTIFIYTNFIDKGVLMIASMLLKNGISLNNSRKDTSSNELLLSKNSGFKNKRIKPNKKTQICYKCYKTHHPVNDHIFKPMLFDYIIGQTTEEVEKRIHKKFNHADNQDGAELKIIVGSSVLKEGVSFLRVRQLHILEPWHNKSRLEQVIARGIRHCSHKSLKKEDRKVNIFLYCATLSNKYNYDNVEKNLVIERLNEIFSIDSSDKIKVDINLARSFNNSEPLLSYDMIMYKRSELSNFYIGKVEKILKKNAFDGSLNRNLNLVNEDYKLNGFDENYNFDIDEHLDTSTYNNLFLTPYIKYVISIIIKYFKTDKILKIKDLISNPRLSDNIYHSNNNYIIQKALNLIIPNDDNMNNFPYIIEHLDVNGKLKYGYIIKRKLDNNNFIYIFKNFDDDKFIRSKFEQTPIYENYYDITHDNSATLNNFLISLKKKDFSLMNKKLDNIEYTDILNNVNKSKPKSNNIGTLANRIIKKNFKQRNNYNKLVAIKIKGNKFNNEIWIRNTEEVNQTGRRCNNAFDKDELRLMLKNIWKPIIEANRQNEYITNSIISFEDFIKNNQEEYNAFLTKRFKKEKICPFIEKLFKYANDKKINKKLWYQLLNDS